MAFTKVVGPGIHTLAQLRTHNIHSAGIITATKFVGEMESGGGESTFQNVTVQGNLTVQGDQTTLNTTLRNVELLRVSTASTLPAGIITQTGSGDLLQFFDSATQVGTLTDEGNLGLGVNSPNVKLHVKSTATGGGNIAFFDDSGSGNTGRLMILTTGGAATDGIRFQVVNRKYTYFGNATSKITIDNNNSRVGIGSDTPGRALTITNAEPRIRLQDADTGGHAEIYTDNNHNLQFSADSSSSSGSSQFFFRVNGTEKVRIQEDGDIIYGPGDHIIGGDPALIQGQGSHHNNNMSTITYGINDGGNTCGMRVENFDDGTYNAQRVKFLTAKGGFSMATVRMTIDEDGRVGIGSTLPLSSVKLDVVGKSRYSDDLIVLSGKILTLLNPANTANVKVACDGGARLNVKSYDKSVIQAQENWGVRFFQGNETERLAIEPTGGIVVGTGGTIYMPEYIKHSGDTDTRFGFSGDNTFKIYTNDAQRLQINNTGVFQFNHSSVGGYYNFQGPTSDNNWGGYLKLNSYNNTTVKAEIRASTNGMWFQYGDSIRLILKQTGKVGIGTDNPSFFTHIQADGITNDALKITANGAGQMVNIRNHSNTANIVRFANYLGNAFWDAQYNTDNSFALDYNDSEKFRISSGGQVRMNTSGDPQADLHVGGTSGVLNGLFATSSSTGAYHKYALGDNGADLGYIGSARQISSSGQSAGFALRSQGHIEFCTGGSTEKIRITSSGKTIISSPNAVAQTPAAILDVFNQGTTTQALRVYRNDLNDNTLAAFQSYHNSIGIVDKMVITSRGRVGINTNNPQRELHVKPWDNNPATAAPGYIRIEGQGSNQPAILELYHTRGNGADKWPVSVGTDDAAMTFNVATGNNGSPQEKVRITSGGDVVVGSFTPVDTRNSGGIHIQPNKGIAFKAYSSASDSRNWRIRNDDAAWGNLDFSVGDNNTTDIGSGAADVVLALAKNHKVGINSITPQHPLDVSGNIRSYGQTPSLYLQTTANTAESAIIRFGDTGSFQRASIQYDFSGINHMRFKMGGYGNNVEKMALTGAGCLNIGGDYSQQDDRLHVEAAAQMEAIGIGGTTRGIRFGWDGDRSAYDDIRMYRVDYSNSGTFGIAGNLPCFVLTPTSAPGSGIVQETVWLKSTGRGSGNNEMNLMVDGDVVIGGDGQVPGGSQSGYPSSLVGGLGKSKLTIQPDHRTTAFDASDGDTWHDLVLIQGGGATRNAVGIAFEIEDGGSYHKNAGTGIAAVKNGTNSDYGSDLRFINRPQNSVAKESARITSKGQFLRRQRPYSEAYQDANFGNADVIKSGWMRFNSNFSNPTKDLVILADGGNANNNMFIKVTVVQLDYPGTQQGLGSIHIGYASAKRYGDSTGKWYVEKSNMALESGSNFHGIYSNVGTLSWENSNPSDTNTLRYTSNRYANYDNYNVQVEVWENGNCPYYLHSDFVE